MIGSTQYSIIRTPFCPNADLWLFGLSGPEVQIIKNNVERSLQRNGCLGSKVLTLFSVLKVSMILYAFLQLAAPLPICTFGNIWASPGGNLWLCCMSLVWSYLYTMPLPCGTDVYSLELCYMVIWYIILYYVIFDYRI